MSSRVEESANRMYDQAKWIQAKKDKLKQELENRETREIEEAKKIKLNRLKENKKKFALSSKPIYKRAEGLVDRKNKNVQTIADRALLNKKVAKVKAEYEQQV